MWHAHLNQFGYGFRYIWDSEQQCHVRSQEIGHRLNRSPGRSRLVLVTLRPAFVTCRTGTTNPPSCRNAFRSRRPRATSTPNA